MPSCQPPFPPLPENPSELSKMKQNLFPEIPSLKPISQTSQQQALATHAMRRCHFSLAGSGVWLQAETHKGRRPTQTNPTRLRFDAVIWRERDTTTNFLLREATKTLLQSLLSNCLGSFSRSQEQQLPPACKKITAGTSLRHSKANAWAYVERHRLV